MAMREGGLHWGWQWAGISTVVGLLDFGVRIATGHTMTWVVRTEAVLLLGTALLLWWLQRRRPAPGRTQHAVQWGLVASFLLGGIRAALWGGGLPVEQANLVIGILGLAILLTGIRRWRAGGGRWAPGQSG